MEWRSLVTSTMFLAVHGAVLAQSSTYGLGKVPTAEEIKAWDIAISPDGKELPPGSGTAVKGAALYVQKGCASCHGRDGRGGQAIALVEPEGKHMTFVANGDRMPAETILVTFSPFATTIWDFINRAMPLKAPGTLKADEVYALTAFLFYKNNIIKENDVLDAQTLPKVKMPNRDGFVPPPNNWQPGKASHNLTIIPGPVENK